MRKATGLRSGAGTRLSTRRVIAAAGFCAIVTGAWGWQGGRPAIASSAADARRGGCAAVAPPKNGTILQRSGTGLNALVVENGLPDDAVVLLRSSDGKVRDAFFVAADESARFNDIQDGTYRIEYASGRDFSRRCMRFATILFARRFDRPAIFQTTLEDGQAVARVIEIDLHALRGTAMTVAIDPDEFGRALRGAR